MDKTIESGTLSGTTNHVTNSLGSISVSSKYQGNDKLAVETCEKLLISHIGNIHL